MEARLAALVDRLEKAVEALEPRISSSEIVDRVELVVERLEAKLAPSQAISSPAPPTLPQAKSSPAPPSSVAPVVSSEVLFYESEVLSKLSDLASYAEATGIEDIKKLTSIVASAFQFSGKLLKQSSLVKKPTDQDVTTFILPVLKPLINQALDIKANRQVANHAQAVSEGIQAAQWPLSNMAVTIVQSAYESSKFYINRVLGERVEANTKWVKKLDEILKALIEFVTENYKMGVDWNPRGANFSGLTEETKEETKQETKQETKEETKREPKEETKSVVKLEKEARVFDRGNDLIFENFKGRKDLVVEESQCRISRGILVDNCVDCVLSVKAKVKNIVITSCVRTGVLLTEVISGVEIVNSKKVQVQTSGKVPSFTIDSTEGVEAFLGGDAKDHVVFAVAKSVDMTVTVPDEANPDEWTELAIPHQHVHRIVKGKVTSEVSELYR